jgi:predicted adenylyl cyclase CyaB
MSELEIERAYYTFNERNVKALLKHHGTFVGTKWFKQFMFKPSSKHMKFVRVRDDGNIITFTIKQKEATSEYELETELEVSSFATAIRMGEILGLEKNYIIEKIREIWMVNKCEVVFDTYPGLVPYIEVEGPTEKEVKEVATLLKLIDEPQTVGAKELYLEHYGITTDRPLDDLTFVTAPKIMGKYVTKNKKLFVQRLKAQAKVIKSGLS